MLTRVPLEIVVIFAAAMTACSGPAAPTEQDPLKLSPMYYTLKFENDRVRVLDYHLKPGDKEVMHTHPSYVGYVLSDATVSITTPDGNPSESPLSQGEVVWRDPVRRG